MKDSDLMHDYKGNFSKLDEVGSEEYDVLVYCECGNEFRIYTDSNYRCASCGKVYRIRAILEVGDVIVSQKEIEEQEREMARSWKELMEKYNKR